MWIAESRAARRRRRSSQSGAVTAELVIVIVPSLLRLCGRMRGEQIPTLPGRPGQ
jgi:hypothetical protein